MGVGSVGQFIDTDAGLSGFIAEQIFNRHFKCCFKVLVFNRQPVGRETFCLSAAGPFSHNRNLTKPVIGFTVLIRLKIVTDGFNPLQTGVLFQSPVKRADNSP